MMHTFTSIEAKLRRLAKLPVGWDYGSGGPISQRAKSDAVTLAYILDQVGVDGFNVMPGHDGSVMLVAYRQSESVEIEVLNHGQYILTVESSVGLDPHPLLCLSLEILIVSLGEAGWRSPRLFASCTRHVMTPSSDDLTHSLSETQAAAEYRSFAVHVSSENKIQNVSTSGPFTSHQLPETHQSSGSFQLIKWATV